MTNWENIGDMGSFRTRYAKEHEVKTFIGEFVKRGYEVKKNGSDFYEVYDEPVSAKEMVSETEWKGYSKDSPIFTALCIDCKNRNWVIRFHIGYFNWDAIDGDNWTDGDIVSA